MTTVDTKNVQNDPYKREIVVLDLIKEMTFLKVMDRPIDLDSIESTELSSDLLANGCLELIIVDKDGNILSGRHRAKIMINLNQAGKWARKIAVTQFTNYSAEGKSYVEIVSFMASFNKRAKASHTEEQERRLLINDFFEKKMSRANIADALHVSLATVSNALTINVKHEQIKDLMAAGGKEVGTPVLKILTDLVGNDNKMVIDEELMKLVKTPGKLKKELERRANLAKKEALEKQLGGMDGELKSSFSKKLFDAWWLELLEMKDDLGLSEMDDFEKRCYIKLEIIQQLDPGSITTREKDIAEKRREKQAEIDEVK